MSREFLERLTSAPDELRWLTRTAEGRAEVVWAIAVDGLGAGAIDEIDEAVAQWLGFSHPRVGGIVAQVVREQRRIAYAVDDDRGPSLVDAAAALADPADRERWAVAQTITIADALAAMAGHQPGYAHGRLEPQHVFVDRGGHARLRAPLTAPTGAAHVIGRMYVDPPTPASDASALAAQLACALTGAPFFARIERGEDLSLIPREPAPPSRTVTRGVARVLSRALAQDPGARYPDPGAFGAALHACLPDAADYDAVLSDRIAEWWPAIAQPPWSPPPRFPDRPCRLRWDELAPHDRDIRRCEVCRQPVVHVGARGEVFALTRRRCTSYGPR